MNGSDLDALRSGIESFNRGDLDAAAELFDPEVVVHDPQRTGNTFPGHVGLRRFWAEWLENWDRMRGGKIVVFRFYADRTRALDSMHG